MTDSPDDRLDANEVSSRADSRPPAESANGDRDPPDSADEGGWDDPPRYDSSGSGMRGRDVEVPMRVYKTVTVFSTLIAVLCVVTGFVLLDRATGRAQLPIAEIDPVVALLGIATILFGAAIYAFGTRFRAAGMGKAKTDDDESADNG